MPQPTFVPMFTFGLDLGEMNDYTALAIVKDCPAEIFAPASTAIPAHVELVHLDRPKLGTPYTRIASGVRARITMGTFAGRSELVVDATGVGRAVELYLCLWF